MTPLAGLPILTVTELRAAEAAAVAGGGSGAGLMDTAGRGVAAWAARLGGGAAVLVLCGPGNNGGDGYVAAHHLRAGGVAVEVAAMGSPGPGAAADAARRWDGPVLSLAAARPASVVVDALLGTGATRALSDAAADAVARLTASARLRIAVDVPSGLDADTGRPLGRVAPVEVTLALGALKPAHLLQPGAALCGAVRCIPLGLQTGTATLVLPRPPLTPPDAAAHKYTRGLVAVVAGELPGASDLAATAALRAGAGYAVVLDGAGPPALAAIVQRPFAAGIVDRRIGALLVGPGLGRGEAARSRLSEVLDAGHPLVIDGDALHLLDPAAAPAGAILTPHGGEFDAMFGSDDASKLVRTRAAAVRTGAVVVHKGADTVVASPDGRAAIAPAASPWLSTAGTGDVLAGAIAAFRAGGHDPFAAAQAGMWLHTRAAAALGPAFVADDLAQALGAVR